MPPRGRLTVSAPDNPTPSPRTVRRARAARIAVLTLRQDAMPGPVRLLLHVSFFGGYVALDRLLLALPLELFASTIVTRQAPIPSLEAPAAPWAARMWTVVATRISSAAGQQMSVVQRTLSCVRATAVLPGISAKTVFVVLRIAQCVMVSAVPRDMSARTKKSAVNNCGSIHSPFHAAVPVVPRAKSVLSLVPIPKRSAAQPSTFAEAPVVRPDA